MTFGGGIYQVFFIGIWHGYYLHSEAFGFIICNIASVRHIPVITILADFIALYRDI
jgi:hypothetical protein